MSKKSGKSPAKVPGYRSALSWGAVGFMAFMIVDLPWKRIPLDVLGVHSTISLLWLPIAFCIGLMVYGTALGMQTALIAHASEMKRKADEAAEESSPVDSSAAT